MKYLSVKADSKSNWKNYVNTTATKSNWEESMLCKLRSSVNVNILNSIYYYLSELRISCHCNIWGQRIGTINRLYILQKYKLRITNFKEPNAQSLLFFLYS